MLSKSQISVFALSLLFASDAAAGRPLESEPKRVIVSVTPVVLAQRAQAPFVAAVTVIVSGTATATPTGVAVTVTAGSVGPSTSASAAGNFGSCSIPQIEFGAGFDGRTETSFQPVDKVSYNHSSSGDIRVITKFICNALVNTCKADAAARGTCAKAQAAASAEAPLQGIDADAFNAVFGIQTNFKNVAAISNTGSTITIGHASSSAPPTSAPSSAPSSDNIGNFGSCSIPQIEFGTGFDGRKETSFRPVDRTSYNHNSAGTIDVISRFVCDALTNTCGADATAKARCAQAEGAASTTGGGVDADVFNSFFGITTNFAAVAEVDDQGRTISNSASSPTVSLGTPTDVPSATNTPASFISTNNLQVFTGALSGDIAPAVAASGDQFQVDGNSVFNRKSDALSRSCSVQHNKCANAANASRNKAPLTVAACDAQEKQCEAASA
ncbi:hypothetical protein C8J57DRAFT_707379 [Mycena rebaudengoi]|nr:hypothetical protein C8J57DRAFT_707379 [Mycena rebaudengoi]